VNNGPSVVMVPSFPTPLAMVSSEFETYLGLLILAAFWAFFSGAVVALNEREASQREALGWAASFAVASLVAAFCFGVLL
jgi:cytochrome bd-type quinol oxidase subunit 2